MLNITAAILTRLDSVLQTHYCLRWALDVDDFRVQRADGIRTNMPVIIAP